MKAGNKKFFFLYFILFLIYNTFSFSENKISSIPLINLEDLSPTFEEDKDELEKIEEKNINLNKSINLNNEDELKKK